MIVLCEQCGHTASATEHSKSGLSGFFSSDQIEYTCANCGSGEALRKVQYCTRCGHVGVPHIQNVKEISIGLLIVLLVFGIIPGLIYLLIGGSTQPYYECTQCTGRLVLIPVDSPVAQSALSRTTQVIPELNASSKESRTFCTSCGNVLAPGGQ